MALLAELFKQNKTFNRLNHRRHTFYKMIEHLDKFESGYIIETGTLRITNNWEGDGQSTQIWEWVLNNKPKFECLSVDISPDAVKISSETCPSVMVTESDSVQFLNGLPDQVLSDCRLLYLDSFDWSPEIQLDSAFHHMSELATVWAKLPNGCMIVVDDRHNAKQGKHIMVEFFMEKHGYVPVFSDYQIGWVKS